MHNLSVNVQRTIIERMPTSIRLLQLTGRERKYEGVCIDTEHRSVDKEDNVA